MRLARLIALGPPPAPETPSLRRRRTGTVYACALSAVAVAATEVLARLHPWAVLLVLVAVVHCGFSLWRYWSIKARVDADYAAALVSDDTQGRGG